MLYLQRLGIAGSNLIYKGKAYNFDTLGFYKGEVRLNFTGAEPVKVVSYLTQGGMGEVAVLDDNGDILDRLVRPMTEFINTLTTVKNEKNCLGVLIRNVIIEGITATNYLVLYKRQV